LTFGVFLAGMIAHLVPREFFASMVGTGFLSMLAMILVGLPLYVCSTASVPVAYAMLMKGLTPGAALVFLAVGPATNVATITTMVGVMGWRVTAIYLGSIVVTSLAFGALLNFLYGLLPGLFPLQGAYAGAMLPPWFKVAAGLVLALATGYALFKRMRNMLAGSKGSEACKEGVCSAGGNWETMTLEIGGMDCPHCVSRVWRVLADVDGVKEVEIRPREGEGVVRGVNIDERRILEVLKTNGYSARIRIDGGGGASPHPH